MYATSRASSSSPSGSESAFTSLASAGDDDDDDDDDTEAGDTSVVPHRLKGACPFRRTNRRETRAAVHVDMFFFFHSLAGRYKRSENVCRPYRVVCAVGA